MDPSTNPDIMLELSKKQISLNLANNQWSMKNSPLHFSSINFAFIEHGPLGPGTSMKKVTEANVKSSKQLMIDYIKNRILHDDQMKYNIQLVIEFIDQLLNIHSDSDKLEIAKDLKAHSKNFRHPFEESTLKNQQEQELSKFSIGLEAASTENLINIYHTFSQRIQHLYYLV